MPTSLKIALFGVIFLDYSLLVDGMWATVDFMGKKTVLGCDVTIGAIIHLIEHNIAVKDDFQNIIFYCDPSETIAYLKQVFIGTHTQTYARTHAHARTNTYAHTQIRRQSC